MSQGEDERNYNQQKIRKAHIFKKSIAYGRAYFEEILPWISYLWVVSRTGPQDLSRFQKVVLRGEQQ